MLRLKFRVPKTLQDLQHKGEHFFHMSYLGFTAVEAHGWHANAAGALLAVTVMGLFFHTEG